MHIYAERKKITNKRIEKNQRKILKLTKNMNKNETKRKEKKMCAKQLANAQCVVYVGCCRKKKFDSICLSCRYKKAIAATAVA